MLTQGTSLLPNHYTPQFWTSLLLLLSRKTLGHPCSSGLTFSEIEKGSGSWGAQWRSKVLGWGWTSGCGSENGFWDTEVAPKSEQTLRWNAEIAVMPASKERASEFTWTPGYLPPFYAAVGVKGQGIILQIWLLPLNGLWWKKMFGGGVWWEIHLLLLKVYSLV